MADMREVSPWNTELPHFADGFFQVVVGDMFLMTQRIQHDDLTPPDLILFRLLDAIGVRDIRKIAKPEPQHRHFQMPYLDGLNGNIPDHKRLSVDPVETDLRDAGVFQIGKSIRKFTYYG